MTDKSVVCFNLWRERSSEMFSEYIFFAAINRMVLFWLQVALPIFVVYCVYLLVVSLLAGEYAIWPIKTENVNWLMFLD